jgi:predicted RNase H-like nuclease (RuvC/YqgF family)
MGEASEVIYRLKPVSFRYKPEVEATRLPALGLIAEDVEKINPDLVIRDQEGKPYSGRYEQVNAMLLNEFLKEHRKVEELKSTVATKLATMGDLKSTVAQQQQEIQALAATVKEQTAQIQKVSAQLAAASSSRGRLEASKFVPGRIRRGGPAPQVVSNNQ